MIVVANTTPLNYLVLIGEVVRMRHDRTKAPALYFRSRLYEGFEARVLTRLVRSAMV